MKSKQIIYLFFTYAYTFIFTFFIHPYHRSEGGIFIINREVELKIKLFLGIKFSFISDISYIKIKYFY